MTCETPDVVIPDTSCLIALECLGLLDLLREFYGSAVVPPAVAREFGGRLPDWLQTESTDDARLLAVLGGSLGAGESECIALASARPNALVVLDDLRARRVASTMGLRLTGTVGVLLRAKREGRLASVDEALAASAAVGFRLSDELRAEALRLAGEGD